MKVKPANAADNTLVEDAIKATKEITGNKVETVHANGAYQSEENCKLASDTQNGFDFIANGIQGKHSRFELSLQEYGRLEVTDKQSCEITTTIPTCNNKTRYIGIIKHTLQALARCAWINMR